MDTNGSASRRMWILLTAAIAAGAFAFIPSTASANGCITHSVNADGTAAHPFLIATVYNLECIRGNRADYWTGRYFRQTADLDMSGQPVWDSTIGDEVTPFTGHYDGNNKRIAGLQVALVDATNAGLFGVTSGATLANLTLTDAQVSLPQTTDFTNVGALVGWAKESTVISHVQSSGTITGQGAGGIAGKAESGTAISSASSSATIVGNDWGAGGLVGAADHASITDSSASGQVTGDNLVGGLVGVAFSDVLLTRSFATGNVTGRPPHVGYVGDSGYVGGLVGLFQYGSSISDSFATGDVTATDPTTPSPTSCGSCAGGLAGGSATNNLHPGNVITNSYATGSVTSGVSAGGLVGTNLGDGNLTIAQSYSRSAVRGPDGATGGVVGSAPAGSPVITATFWNPTDAGSISATPYGTQASQAAMQTPTLYATAGWDIADAAPATTTWVSCAAHNSGYPFLQWWGTTQNWSCQATATGAGGSTPSTPATPDAAGRQPRTPTGITWRVAGTTVTSTFTAAQGTTYAITAARVTTMAREASRAATRRGRCTTSTSATTAKRTATCTIRLARGATWLVKVTPRSNGTTGMPATRRIRIQAKPAPLRVTG